MVLLWCLSLFAGRQQTAAGFRKTPAAKTVGLPESVPDPIEPFNRVISAQTGDMV